MGTFYLTRCVEILCLFGFFRPSREIFTNMETTPLAVKGCKFRRMPIVWQWRCHYLFKQLSICRIWNWNTQPSVVEIGIGFGLEQFKTIKVLKF